jgi:Ca2+-binding RTX toxin-like protein
MSMANLSGTSGNDRINGRQAADTIDGLARNAVLEGRADHDAIYGRTGNDTIRSELGNDKAYGGDGFNLLSRGDGGDQVCGGVNRDRIRGDAGNDILQGFTGPDDLYEGGGTNVLCGGDCNDTIHGGVVCVAFEWPDALATIFGGNGDNRIYGAKLGANARGEAGNERLLGDRAAARPPTRRWFSRRRDIPIISPIRAQRPLENTLLALLETLNPRARSTNVRFILTAMPR